MSRLRIATGFCLSLLLTLIVPLSAQAQDAGWRLLLSEANDLQIDEIRRPEYQAQFTPLNLAQLYIPGGHGPAWLHYRLPASQQQQLLRVFSPFVEELDLYLWQGEQPLSQIHTGNQRPLASRPLPSRDFLLPLPASDAPLDLYLRLSSAHALRPDISLQSASALAADDRGSILFGGLLGGLLMLVLYNLARFTYVRTPSTLWLTAMQLSILFTAMTLLGISTPWLGP